MGPSQGPNPCVARHPMGRFMNTSVSHNHHHEKAGDNYGLYFLWWDRWFGTLDPEYEARFGRLAEREPAKETTAMANG